MTTFRITPSAENIEKCLRNGERRRIWLPHRLVDSFKFFWKEWFFLLKFWKKQLFCNRIFAHEVRPLSRPKMSKKYGYWILNIGFFRVLLEKLMKKAARVKMRIWYSKWADWKCNGISGSKNRSVNFYFFICCPFLQICIRRKLFFWKNYHIFEECSFENKVLSTRLFLEKSIFLQCFFKNIFLWIVFWNFHSFSIIFVFTLYFFSRATSTTSTKWYIFSRWNTGDLC